MRIRNLYLYNIGTDLSSIIIKIKLGACMNTLLGSICINPVYKQWAGTFKFRRCGSRVPGEEQREEE